jgi:TRAP-type C4-dicarboxylate transport system permease small subunit
MIFDSGKPLVLKLKILPKKLSMIAGYLLVAIALLTTWEVFMRYILREPFGWTYEIAGFIFLTVCATGVSCALVDRRHIGVDLFLNILKPKIRSVFDLICLVVTVGWGFVVLIGAWKRAFFNFKTGNVSPNLEIPLFPIEVQAPIGMVIFVLIGFIMIWEDFKRILNNGPSNNTKKRRH